MRSTSFMANIAAVSLIVTLLLAAAPTCLMPSCEGLLPGQLAGSLQQRFAPACERGEHGQPAHPCHEGGQACDATMTHGAPPAVAAQASSGEVSTAVGVTSIEGLTPAAIVQPTRTVALGVDPPDIRGSRLRI